MIDPNPGRARAGGDLARDGAAAAALAAKVDHFRFAGWDYDRADATIRLDYELAPLARFSERVTFEGACFRPRREEIASRVRLLHLLAGVSYYKVACCRRLQLSEPAPGPVLAFVEEVYRQGLGELTLRNRIRLPDRLAFESTPPRVQAPPQNTAASPPRPGTVLPLGGGKDSLVAADCLERASIPYRTIAVGRSSLIDEVAGVLGREHLRIRRRLDPTLFDLNEAGAYNGHVPITGILAAILALGGAFYGYDTIVLANERSAEAPSRVVDGRPVNHQYSKTLAFERQLGAVLAHEAPGTRYFSLLRPWSELAITRRFATLERFHAAFSSCNRNFRLRPTGADDSAGRWCGDCPKCRFVFLALAPFLPRARLLAIFGADLLADPAQRPGLEALLGIGAGKPFECVGEVGECRAALTALATHPDWAGEVSLAGLLARCPPVPLDGWLAPSPDHLVPEDFRDAALDGFGA